MPPKKSNKIENNINMTNKLKRCKNGTRKNKKTKICEPFKKKIEMNFLSKKEPIKQSNKQMSDNQYQEYQSLTNKMSKQTELNINNIKEIKLIVTNIKLYLKTKIHELSLSVKSSSKENKKKMRDYSDKIFSMSVAESDNSEEDDKFTEKYLKYLKKICKNEIVHEEPIFIYKIVDLKQLLIELSRISINKDFITNDFFEKEILKIIINNINIT